MKTPSVQGRPPGGFVLSRGLIAALGAFILAPWLVLWLVVRDLGAPAAASATPTVPAAAASAPAASPAQAPTRSEEGTLRAASGPWGNLVYTRILIEPPEEMVGRSHQTSQPTRWLFEGYSAEELTALWHSAGLPPDLIAQLDAPERRRISGNRTEILVPHPLVRALTPGSRAILYAALAAFPANELHAEPFRFRADAIDEWFAGSNVAPHIIELVKSLLYRRGPALLFSDLEVVLAEIPSFTDRTTLIKTLARKSTLLVRLEVDENTDIDALSNYWGRGLRSKDVRPLLESLRRPGVATRIDITHLLPRFARARLYSYPSSGDGASALAYMDCHWTALNFFNLEPNSKYQYIDVVSATLFQDYRSVTGKSALGDILLFARKDGTIVHSSVYIADDIVFTKNGVSEAAPWILMNLADVLAIYPADEPFDIQRYRLKSLP